MFVFQAQAVMTQGQNLIHSWKKRALNFYWSTIIRSKMSLCQLIHKMWKFPEKNVSYSFHLCIKVHQFTMYAFFYRRWKSNAHFWPKKVSKSFEIVEFQRFKHLYWIYDKRNMSTCQFYHWVFNFVFAVVVLIYHFICKRNKNWICVSSSTLVI